MISRILLFIFATVILSACETTSFISLEVQRPAEVNFFAPVKKIVVVDNAVSQPNNFGHLVYAFQKNQDNLSFDAEAFRRLFVNNLVQKLKSDNKIPVSSSRIYSSKTYKDSKALESSEVKEIASSTGADVIISVDNSLIASLYRLNYVHDENLYRLTFDASHSTVLNVFEQVGDSILMNKVIHKDSLYWEAFDYSSEAVILRFPDKKICMEDLINHSVESLCKKLFSNKEIVQRTLYGKGISNMLDATRYAKQNKWTEASCIWEYEYEITKNNRLKGFCAANLALYNEVIDQFDQASYWANVAKGNFQKDDKSRINSDDKSMELYVKDLKQRKVEVTLLEQQKVN